MLSVHNFQFGLATPALAYVMSCLGAFLGLRSAARARLHTGRARTGWLSIAAVSIGALGIWVMHFIAMLGFAIPGEDIRYNIPLTILSMLIAVVVGLRRAGHQQLWSATARPAGVQPARSPAWGLRACTTPAWLP